MTARKDNRPVVNFFHRRIKNGSLGFQAAIVEDSLHVSIGPYTRRADAKRGMVRFLRRIGADTARVRWEGES
jgi:hypothetical protein